MNLWHSPCGRTYVDAPRRLDELPPRCYHSQHNYAAYPGLVSRRCKDCGILEEVFPLVRFTKPVHWEHDPDQLSEMRAEQAADVKEADIEQIARLEQKFLEDEERHGTEPLDFTGR